MEIKEPDKVSVNDGGGKKEWVLQIIMLRKKWTAGLKGFQLDGYGLQLGLFVYHDK